MTDNNTLDALSVDSLPLVGDLSLHTGRAFLFKRCTKCEAEKSTAEFSKDRELKSGLRSCCKECDAERAHQYYFQNREKCIEIARNWQRAHPEAVRQNNRGWEERHPEKHRLCQQKSGFKRRSTPEGKLNCRMGSSISKSLSNEKRGRHWEGLVGYSLQELKKHLESLFLRGMTWNNYGKWHIDHIVPRSRFYFKTAEDVNFKICWGLDNLQPLWAKDNMNKHAHTMEEWATRRLFYAETK